MFTPRLITIAPTLSGVAGRFGLAATAMLATACLFDPDDRCGEGQVYSEESDVCVCENGLALTADGCVKCGRNEVAGAAGCECKPGYARVDNACRRAPAMPDPGDADGGAEPEPSAPMSALGKPCSGPADCAGTDAEYCDALVTMSCLIMGCEIGGSDCPPGYDCLDLSMLGASAPVCAAAVCDLAAPNCPQGFSCCEPAIAGFPPVCLSGGCGG